MIQLNKVFSLKDKDKLAITIHYSTFAAIVIFIPYYFLIKNWDMLIFDSITVFILGLISVTYVKKQFFIGKILTLSGSMLFVYLLSFVFLDHEVRINLFFFLLAISALVIFDYGIKRERITVIFFSILNIALAVLSEIITFKPVFELTQDSINFQRVANTVVFGVILTVMLFLYNTALYRANMELERLASIDMLTGIYNRRSLFEYGQNIIKRDKEASKESIVIMFDIDCFKQINDQYGHLAGDLVLIEISRLIQSDIREGDVFGRYGGEEFVLISEGTREQAKNMAERLRTIIEANQFMINESEDIDVTVSVGVCSEFRLNVELEILIDRADKALYKAKAMGRNRTVLI